MKQIIDFLSGRKTYLVATVGAVALFLKITGYISPEDFDTILALLGITGAMTIRAAITKSTPPTVKLQDLPVYDGKRI